MERRGEPRIKKRIGCELVLGERRFGGLVLDFSSHGLFVQTAATPAPGQPIRVLLSAPGRAQPLELEAVVARTKLVPPQLRNVAQGGIGIHVARPSAEFARFVEEVKRPLKIQKVSILAKENEPKGRRSELTRERLDHFFGSRSRGARADRRSPVKPRPGASGAPKAGPYTRLERWRVQLRHSDGQGSRSFVLRAASEADAREQVLAEIDDDWKIESIARV